MIDERGEGLIFILSQPRAGSTLLQRILGGHPEVHTVQEPGIALYPLLIFRAPGPQQDYLPHAARVFTYTFLRGLSDGEEAYVIALRKMLTHLYRGVLAQSDKRYFLDKTPQYHFIIPELLRVFPAASYVILLRNPLAVLVSMIAAWVPDDFLGLLSRAKADLLDGPSHLLTGRELLGKRAVTVHYESLVREPETMVGMICQHIGIRSTPAMIQYGERQPPARWSLGDPKVNQHTRPDPTNSDRWVTALEDAQVWRLTRDYLRTLGRDLITAMGYNYEELEQTLVTHAPFWTARRSTVSLHWLMRRPRAERALWERALVRLLRQLHRHNPHRPSLP
jgi:Sulfotransferase family